MTNKIKIRHIEEDFSVQEFEHGSWKNAEEISIEKYWSGEIAPVEKHFDARLLWSDSAFYVRFEANQTEPPVISETPNLKTKTRGLWDRDVCEIFVAADKNTPQKYFEFEIAPNGEWIDLELHQLPEGRETNFEYNSGMQSAARIEKDKVLMAVKIEWKAFGKQPTIGDVWMGNLFRCTGLNPASRYLAWLPTETAKPNFHVPEKFGEFEFIK